jgi:aryl-alcohol dehydrogenase-like predicted oxidoreductase
MHHNKLGRTGLFVSELCLGAMTFGITEGRFKAIAGLDQAAADGLIGRAIDAGINFIDTADVYAEGQSEIITGQALKNLKIARENIVVATKAYGSMGPGPNAGGASRLHIIDAVKASLKRLQLDHIDLYQIHGFDPATPIEETVRALDTLVQHGHIRYAGVSNWAAWQIVKATGIAAQEHLARFESLQAYYSIAGRELEREITPMLTSEQIGLLVWSPLAGGFISGKYKRGEKSSEGRRVSFEFPPVDQDRGYACIDAMRPMAEQRNVSVAQIALAWLLHQQVVSSVIIGAKRLDQLNDNIAAAEVRLTGAELSTLAEVSGIPAEYPGWMFKMQAQRENQLEQSKQR